MPLFRYFIVVGSTLTALLFVTDAYVPRNPVVTRADIDRSTIRITSPSPELRAWVIPVAAVTAQ